MKYKYGKSTNHKLIRKRETRVFLSPATGSLSLGRGRLSLGMGRLWTGTVMDIHNMIYNNSVNLEFEFLTWTGFIN